ncbi:glycosyltransferase family 2 protein [Cesiribacter andamanensis]|uniref:Poly-beta-1,6-N-acetyl-D-glucosamine synthase n=1 Tax=Cesiribacter andamanensis AMV16 TaxID=1279009 RepID=M7NGB4_9BACT|nr:glycosyltransferase family 2 protein [Cesiribacter andamanensis]EMR00860.1 Poly-beta-1,6-N-acetyl-D-glucosamine synthase [Cesiribacter andamanensis AMV16]
MKHSISYIMPCYNCADTVDAAIASILETNLQPGDELILVDDASTDSTAEKLQAYADEHEQILLCRHHINKGTAAAGRNTGIDRAAHELIFCLDADNLLYPNSIAPLKEFLLENQLDAAAFGRIDYFTDNPEILHQHWALTEKLSFIDALNNPMKTPCGSGNYLYTKTIWKKVGRYNESVGGAYDSELFGLKLLAEGARFWTLPNTAYLHRQGYESTFIREYQRRNSSLLFLAALIDYWNQLHEDDVAYMFGSGRTSWHERLHERPLRPRAAQPAGGLASLGKRLRRRLMRLLEY